MNEVIKLEKEKCYIGKALGYNALPNFEIKYNYSYYDINNYSYNQKLL